MNREAERVGDWSIMADWYAEDATYGWMYTPDEHFMAVGREEIRDLAIGQEMAGLDGWHYDYQCTMVDEAKGMVLGFWKQRSGITDDATGREYEILGIGGSWFGVERQPDGELKFAWQRDWFDLGSTAHDVPGDRRLRQGAAGAARPDAGRRQEPARPLHLRRDALDAVAAAGGARRLRDAGRRAVTLPPPPQQLVDGKLGPASGGATYPILNPATGKEIGQAPDSTADDVDAAIAAARRAFDEGTWATDVELRVRCLRQLHDALLDVAEEFKALTTAEVGMPGFMMGAAGFDVPVDGLRWVTDLLEGYEFETDLGVAKPMGIASRRTVRREPVGVVAAITPWNVPTQINLAKVGPALAAGCTVVLKPAPDTPWLACELGRLAAERTDLPPGVLNVVTPRSNDVAAQLTTDPRVDMVSFTGSTDVGRAIMAAAAPTLKKVFLELGGKSAAIVLDDADVAAAAGGHRLRRVHPRRPGLRDHHPAGGAPRPLRRGGAGGRADHGVDRRRRPRRTPPPSAGR